MKYQGHQQSTTYYNEILEAVGYLRSRYEYDVDLAIFSGTGLSDSVTGVIWDLVIPYSDIPFAVPTGVPGHKGELCLGRKNGLVIAFFKGRIHYYEGHDIYETTRMSRIAQMWKIPRALYLNAAGGLREGMVAGEVVPICDHIYNLPVNPLRGMQESRWGAPFPDLKTIYSKGLNVLQQAKIELSQPGVYVCLSGPQLETMAEIRFWRRNGADLVGMSTIPDVLVCAQAGVEVMAWSVVTNTFEGTEVPDVTLDEVVAAAASALPKLTSYISNLIDFLGASKPLT